MRRLIIAAVVMLAAALGGPARADILIGMAGPMTGKNAWFGEQMQEGIGMKVTELNAAGGVLGQQIALVPVDDYCDPEQAAAAARKLVEARVDAVWSGPLGPDSSQAAGLTMVRAWCSSNMVGLR